MRCLPLGAVALRGQTAGARPGRDTTAAARSPCFAATACSCPFASFDRDSWRVTWPIRALRPRRFPSPVERSPSTGGARARPISGARYLPDGDASPLPSSASPTLFRVALLTARWPPHLVRRARQVPPVPLDPFPKDGVAISGGVPLEPIETVDPHSPEWAALASARCSRSSIVAEDKTMRGVRLDGELAASASRGQARDTLPFASSRGIVALGRAGMDGLVHRSRRASIRPGPTDQGCGLETARQRLDSSPRRHADRSQADLRGKITYCDRVGATYMLPFGRVRAAQATATGSSSSRAGRSEWYDVAAVAPRLGPLRRRSGRGAPTGTLLRIASMMSSRVRAASGLLGAGPDDARRAAR